MRDGTRVREAFQQMSGARPQAVWWAPGRVNVIGEHTDYNDGFVLPIALAAGVLSAVGRRDDGLLRIASVQVDQAPVEIPLARLRPGTVPGWAAYPAGVAWALAADGLDVAGLDVVVDGDVPLGAGLSSSAAVECSLAAALDELAGTARTGDDAGRMALARLAQRAENDFVGMPCGIMDQAASMLCRSGHALFLDTRTAATQAVPFDLAAAGLALLVVDTRAPHRLVDGEYAARRRDCEHAAGLLGVPALRDIPAGGLATALDRLPSDVLRRRVRHVVTENDRVLATVGLLRAGRLREIGPLMTASHASLRDDYEVTVPELDTAVEAALAAGALGARMTGGGFGGCVIALVPDDRAPGVAGAVADAFAAAGFETPAWFAATPASGAAPAPERPAAR